VLPIESGSVSKTSPTVMAPESDKIRRFQSFSSFKPQGRLELTKFSYIPNNSTVPSKTIPIGLLLG